MRAFYFGAYMDYDLTGYVFLNEGDRYDIDEYWADMQYAEFEGMMEELKSLIAYEKEYGPIMDAADDLAEIESITEYGGDKWTY